MNILTLLFEIRFLDSLLFIIRDAPVRHIEFAKKFKKVLNCEIKT